MELLQTGIVLGLATGLIFATASVGLVVIFRTSGYLSFAQGDIAAVSLYVGLAGYHAGLPYPAVALIVVASGAVLAGLIGAFVVGPLERRGETVGALATVGVGLTIQGIENVVVGTQARPFPSLGTERLFTLGAVDVSPAELGSLIVAVVLFTALGVWFQRSRSGMAMRAANDNPMAARHVGIPAIRLKILSWVLAGALAGVAGLFVAPTYTLTPSSVNTILVFGFCTVVVGGFESILGALIAGVGIGIASNLVAIYLHPQLVSSSIYGLLLLVLLFRPYGLLGRRPLVRV
ncbi:branched-chain amino acid ABC transporter permease [Dactylosporangium sp. NPDC005572]|uniref:branched-chain amino acid ABC transporter permease n=1 Tax=Dactylosporangium sp. NPDC005572 TaxID=3156889 RepID=UPI0033BEE45E